jgi:hypothetical protein
MIKIINDTKSNVTIGMRRGQFVVQFDVDSQESEYMQLQEMYGYVAATASNLLQRIQLHEEQVKKVRPSRVKS